MTGGRGEIYAVPGFLANGTHAGIKEKGQKDLSLIYSTEPAAAAAVFTTNAFKAAPVLLDMERIRSGRAQAILTNSGNANAATGAEGYRNARTMSGFLSKRLGIPDELVLVASTGVIGHRLPVRKIGAAMVRLVRGLRPDGIAAAEEAILTTDRFPKIAMRKGRIGDCPVTLCGMAKGAGMIQPQMATMLSYVMTDAAIEGSALDAVFRQAVGESFNAISVDGCMSTNDTAIILANGRAGNPLIRRRSKSLAIFREMLFGVLSELSRNMVRDGEGATKLIRITVEEARTAGDAKKIAYAVANSNLFKTACFGQDPNWGRIIAAAGAAGVPLRDDAVAVWFEDIPVFRDGRGLSENRKGLFGIMEKADIRITVRLGVGSKSFCLHTSDLTHEYVRINAHYHT